MNLLQLVSIVIESVIVVLALLIAVQRKKAYGFGFALTFAIYVFYDAARLYSLAVNETVLTVSFFVATVSMLWAVWLVYRAK